MKGEPVFRRNVDRYWNGKKGWPGKRFYCVSFPISVTNELLLDQRNSNRGTRVTLYYKPHSFMYSYLKWMNIVNL